MRDNSKWNTLGFQAGTLVRPLVGDLSRQGKVLQRAHPGGRERQYQVQWPNGSTSWLWERHLQSEPDPSIAYNRRYGLDYPREPVYTCKCGEHVLRGQPCQQCSIQQGADQ